MCTANVAFQTGCQANIVAVVIITASSFLHSSPLHITLPTHKKSFPYWLDLVSRSEQTTGSSELQCGLVSKNLTGQMKDYDGTNGGTDVRTPIGTSGI